MSEMEKDVELLKEQVIALKQQLDWTISRQEYLKDTILTLLKEKMEVSVSKLELKKGDVLAFTVPDSIAMDNNFFDAVGKIFADRSIQAIVFNKGIEINITRNVEDEKKEKIESEQESANS